MHGLDVQPEFIFRQGRKLEKINMTRFTQKALGFAAVFAVGCAVAGSATTVAAATANGAASAARRE